MKKFFMAVLAAVLAVGTCLGFVGCQDIENKTGNSRLHGVWYLESFKYDGACYSTPESNEEKLVWLGGQYPLTYDYMQIEFFEDGGVEMSGKTIETATGQIVKYRQKRGDAGNFTVDFILDGKEYVGVEETSVKEEQRLEIESEDFWAVFVRAEGSYSYEECLNGETKEIDFFEVKDSLQLSQIQKIQVAIYGGSVDPAHRPPTTYFLSGAEKEIALMHAWFSGMNDQTLMEISPSETEDGGGARVLTVYTNFGTFSISCVSPQVVCIGGKYFEYGEGMPFIEGQTVTYRFDDSLDETLHFYKWGRYVKDYHVKLSELSFKTADYYATDMLDVGFMLKQDVGNIKLYSEKLFYHDGTDTFYEIVGDKDFSIIFSTNESLTEKDLENIETLKETYATGFPPHVGRVYVVNYYGVYGNAIVAMMADSETIVPPVEQVEWTDFVAGQEFKYFDEHSIAVWYDGKFYSLAYAYELGYLTEEDIEEIALKHLVFEYWSVIF